MSENWKMKDLQGKRKNRDVPAKKRNASKCIVIASPTKGHVPKLASALTALTTVSTRKKWSKPDKR